MTIHKKEPQMTAERTYPPVNVENMRAVLKQIEAE